MDIYACGSRPTRRAPAESFTGTVWQEPIIEAPAPARVRAGLVRFEPGARTAGTRIRSARRSSSSPARAGCKAGAGKVREIKAGDVVWIPPNEKHWHGAAPTTAWSMSRPKKRSTASTSTWMEHVSDEQYKAPVGGSE